MSKRENEPKANISHYNHTPDFKEQCLPAIVVIKQFCLARGVPFYMTFATSNDEKGTEYLTSKQFPPECGTELADDKFRKIVLAEHGFDLMLNHVDTFEMEDIADILFPGLNAAQRKELLDLCCKLENDYLRKHGAKAYYGQ